MGKERTYELDELKAENEGLKTALRSEIANRHGIDEESASRFIGLGTPEQMEQDCKAFAQRLSVRQEEQERQTGSSVLSIVNRRYRLPGAR